MTTVVETPSGKLVGRESDGVRTFLGIPFAKPPVGALRFAAPEPIAPWAGERQAVEFGGSALQAAMVIPLPGMEVGRQDEDCLYLNVYDAGRTAASPEAGDGVDPRRRLRDRLGLAAIYDGARLARRGDVVVVTINYRLGALGYLHSTRSDHDPGRGAEPRMRDQVAALEWVREPHRGVRRRSGQRHDLRRVGGRDERRHSPRDAEGEGALPVARSRMSGAAHALIHRRAKPPRSDRRAARGARRRGKDASRALREMSAQKILGAQSRCEMTARRPPARSAAVPAGRGRRLAAAARSTRARGRSRTSRSSPVRRATSGSSSC